MVVAASLLPVTRNLRFLVAVRPGLHQPALAARMAATFDRLSGGRLLINLVTGGDQAELEGDGVFLDHATRYEQSAEFIRIWREILTRSHQGESLDFEGKHLAVKGAKLLFPPVQQPHTAGVLWRLIARRARPGSRAGRDVSDLGRTPAEVAKKVADVRARAAKHGRTVKFGIRLHVIVRETDEQAGPPPKNSSATSATTPWCAPRPCLHAWIPKASAAWLPSTLVAAPGGRSRKRPGNQPQPVGRVWAWCAAARHRLGG